MHIGYMEIFTAGTFIATAALAIIALVQIQMLRNQMMIDFDFKFNREFFQNKLNRAIIETIEEKRPLFKSDSNKKGFSEYDIDDFIGYFDMMKNYLDKRSLDFKLIDESFGHYIIKTWDNKEIALFIKNLRRETRDPRYYKPFEELAMKLKKEVEKHKLKQ